MHIIIRIRERIYPTTNIECFVVETLDQRKYYVVIRQPDIISRRENVYEEILKVLGFRYLYKAEIFYNERVFKTDFDRVIKILKNDGPLMVDLSITTFRYIDISKKENEDNKDFKALAIGEISISKLTTSREMLFSIFLFCAEGGTRTHKGKPHKVLSLARLPISPPRLKFNLINFLDVFQ